MPRQRFRLAFQAVCAGFIAASHLKMWNVRPLAGSNMLRMQGTTFDFWILQMCRARRTDTSLMVNGLSLPPCDFGVTAV
jgi:hypothetical protein